MWKCFYSDRWWADLHWALPGSWLLSLTVSVFRLNCPDTDLVSINLVMLGGIFPSFFFSEKDWEDDRVNQNSYLYACLMYTLDALDWDMIWWAKWTVIQLCSVSLIHVLCICSWMSAVYVLHSGKFHFNKWENPVPEPKHPVQQKPLKDLTLFCCQIGHQKCPLALNKSSVKFGAFRKS